jgi:hypothetical protein
MPIGSRPPPGRGCALGILRGLYGDQAVKEALMSPVFGRRYQAHAEWCAACASIIHEFFPDGEIPFEDGQASPLDQTEWQKLLDGCQGS